jgi:hypothetical protein
MGVGGNWHLQSSNPSALATWASAIFEDASAASSVAVIPLSRKWL